MSRVASRFQGPNKALDEHLKTMLLGTKERINFAENLCTSKAEIYSLDAADLQHCGPDDDALVPEDDYTMSCMKIYVVKHCGSMCIYWHIGILAYRCRRNITIESLKI